MSEYGMLVLLLLVSGINQALQLFDYYSEENEDIVISVTTTHCHCRSVSSHTARQSARAEQPRMGNEMNLPPVQSSEP